MTEQAQAEDRRAQWTVYGEGCILTSGLIIPIFDGNGRHSRVLARQLCDIHNAELARLSRVEQALRELMAKWRESAAWGVENGIEHAASTYYQCADEVEAALSASPEAQPEEGR